MFYIFKQIKIDVLSSSGGQRKNVVEKCGMAEKK
jgi:hypothetical protein